MRIGILETGKVSAELIDTYGSYPAMFDRLLGQALPGVVCETVPILDGARPESPDAADAWLVTGSRHGVYDDLPWIAPLSAFLREARAARRPIVGVCFGHQLLAQALGGRAEKSPKGWGCGVHGYEVARRPGWMADASAETRFHAMHQDQVTVLPPDATVLAASEFCPHAMLAYGDPEAPEAISIQPHPEFEAPYARDLVLRRTGIIAEPVAEAALASFGQPVDNAAFARWTIDYLRRALAPAG